MKLLAATVVAALNGVLISGSPALPGTSAAQNYGGGSTNANDYGRASTPSNYGGYNNYGAHEQDLAARDPYANGGSAGGWSPVAPTPPVGPPVGSDRVGTLDPFGGLGGFGADYGRDPFEEELSILDQFLGVGYGGSLMGDDIVDNIGALVWGTDMFDREKGVPDTPAEFVREELEESEGVMLGQNRFADLSGCGSHRTCPDCTRHHDCMWSESGCTKNLFPGAPQQWCSPEPRPDTVKQDCEFFHSCQECTRTAGCIYFRGSCTYSRGTGCLEDPYNCVNYEWQCPAHFGGYGGFNPFGGLGGHHGGHHGGHQGGHHSGHHGRHHGGHYGGHHGAGHIGGHHGGHVGGHHGGDHGGGWRPYNHGSGHHGGHHGGHNGWPYIVSSGHHGHGHNHGHSHGLNHGVHHGGYNSYYSHHGLNHGFNHGYYNRPSHHGTHHGSHHGSHHNYHGSSSYQAGFHAGVAAGNAHHTPHHGTHHGSHHGGAPYHGLINAIEVPETRPPVTDVLVPVPPTQPPVVFG